MYEINPNSDLSAFKETSHKQFVLFNGLVGKEGSRLVESLQSLLQYFTL